MHADVAIGIRNFCALFVVVEAYDTVHALPITTICGGFSGRISICLRRNTGIAYGFCDACFEKSLQCSGVTACVAHSTVTHATVD